MERLRQRLDNSKFRRRGSLCPEMLIATKENLNTYHQFTNHGIVRLMWKRICVRSTLFLLFQTSFMLDYFVSFVDSLLYNS